jgi:DNA-binding NtrC family response regulator
MGIAPDAMNFIRIHPFYGNIRELQNLIERAVALCISGIIQCDDLPRNFIQTQDSKFEERSSSIDKEEFPEEGVNLDAILLDKEREWINRALAYTRNDISFFPIQIIKNGTRVTIVDDKLNTNKRTKFKIRYLNFVTNTFGDNF